MWLCLWSLLLVVWCLDYTDFYYCLTTNFVTDWIDQKWDDFFYDWYVIESYEERNEFFEAFMNSEMYEICYPDSNTYEGMKYIAESFTDLGIDLSKYDLENEESYVKLYDDFLKAINIDLEYIKKK